VSIYAVNGKEPIAAWIPSRDTAGNGTTTLNDLVGSNNGTLTNMDPATDWPVSDGKAALDFDGANDYVNCGTGGAVGTTTLPFSVSIWAYARSLGNEVGVISRDQSHPFAFSIRLNSSGVFELITDAANLSFGVVFPTLSWVHICVVCSPGLRQIYQNGVLVASSTAAYTVTANADSLFIGTDYISGVGRNWNGLVDDVRVSNQALSAADVAYLYKGGLGRGRQWKVEPFDVNGKKPVAVWCESRDPEPTSSTIVTDLIGTNNGTMTNMDPATDRVADTGAGGIRALDFDGSNDYVVMNNARASVFSLSIWVKGAAQSDRRFFAFGNSSSNSPAYAFGSGAISTSKFRIFIRNDLLGTLLLDDSNGNVFDGTWHHVLWTDNAGSASLYIDGALDKTFAYTPSTTTTNLSSIGAWARVSTPVSFFIGRTDDARIFHSALDLADAQYLWAGGFGRGITAGGGIIPILRQHYAAMGAR
jgi:hypothetical protein